MPKDNIIDNNFENNHRLYSLLKKTINRMPIVDIGELFELLELMGYRNIAESLSQTISDADKGLRIKQIKRFREALK